MRIAVDGQRLAGQRLGVGRYIEYLLKHWDRMLHPDDSVTVFTREPQSVDGLGLAGPIRMRALGPALTGQLWQNLVLPRESAAWDVLFCPSYFAPQVGAGRKVVAVHSINEMDPASLPWWYRFTYSPLYRRSARRADRVIVPAASTKHEVEEHYGVPSDRIDIVAQGTDESFHPIDDPKVLRATRIKYLGADVPYVLFVGKLSVRRNIPVLLEAFAKLKKGSKIPHKLLLVGPNHVHLPFDEIVTRLGLRDSVVQTDGRFAHHTELVPIYGAADVFVHPSSYEGFSMTTVEAFACGVPVVTVNRAGLREVASGYARMVEEPTAEAIAEAIHDVLSDPELSRRLRASSLQRSLAFRWENTARETLDSLRRAAA